MIEAHVRKERADDREPWRKLSKSRKKTQSFKKLWDFLEVEADSKDMVLVAFHQIVEAIGDYESVHLPMWDKRPDKFTDMLESGPAEMRRELRQIWDALQSTQLQIRALPLNSRRLLARATGLSFRELDRVLVPLAKASRRAILKADDMPNKPPDDARDYLARDVARVMRDVLKKTPTRTRDEPLGDHAKSGALYARLLRVTFKVIGVEQYSTGKVVRRGIDLLDKNADAGNCLPDDSSAS